jgi:hypothetical protein
VASVPEIRIGAGHEPEIGLVHESRGVQGAIRLRSEPVVGEATEAVVDQGNELVERTRIPTLPAPEQAGDVLGGRAGHGGRRGE